MENPTENIVEVAQITAKVLFLSFWLISDPISLLITEASVCKQRVTPLSSGVRAIQGFINKTSDKLERLSDD